MIFNCFCPSSIFSLLQHLRPGLTDDDVPDRCSRFRDRNHLAKGFVTYSDVHRLHHILRFIFHWDAKCSQISHLQLETRVASYGGRVPTHCGHFPRLGNHHHDMRLSNLVLVRNWQGCTKCVNQRAICASKHLPERRCWGLKAGQGRLWLKLKI